MAELVVSGFTVFRIGVIEMGLSALNQADIDEARQMLMQCCTSSQWVEHMINSRPFAGKDKVFCQADAHWNDLTEDDYLEAFDGHPKIGNIDSLKAKYADTKKLAAGEQSGMEVADDKVIEVLAKGNLDYEQKFGFIFIVCASGKTAVEMSQLLLDRLPNDRQTEIRIAAEEQRKIFHIRITKLLDESS